MTEIKQVEQDARLFRIGMLVAVDGLSKTELNRRFGTVTKVWNAETDRVGVSMHSNKEDGSCEEPVALKVEKLTPIEISVIFASHISNETRALRLLQGINSVKDQKDVCGLRSRVYLSFSVDGKLEGDQTLVNGLIDLPKNPEFDQRRLVVLPPPVEKGSTKFMKLSQYQHIVRTANCVEFDKYESFTHHWVFFHGDSDLSGPTKMRQFLQQMKAAYQWEVYKEKPVGVESSVVVSSSASDNGNLVTVIAGHGLAQLDARFLKQNAKNRPDLTLTDNMLDDMRTHLESDPQKVGDDVFIEPNTPDDVSGMLQRGLAKVGARNPNGLGDKNEVFELAVRSDVLRIFFGVVGEKEKSLGDTMMLRSPFADRSFFSFVDQFRSLPGGEGSPSSQTLHVISEGNDYLHFYRHDVRREGAFDWGKLLEKGDPNLKITEIVSEAMADGRSDVDCSFWQPDNFEKELLEGNPYFEPLRIFGDQLSDPVRKTVFSQFRRSTEAKLCPLFGRSKFDSPVSLLETFINLPIPTDTKNIETLELSQEIRDDLYQFTTKLMMRNPAAILGQDLAGMAACPGQCPEVTDDSEVELSTEAKKLVTKQEQLCLSNPLYKYHQLLKALSPYMALGLASSLRIPVKDRKEVMEYTKERSVECAMVHQVQMFLKDPSFSFAKGRN